MPAEEHRQFVLYQGRMLLTGIAEQSPPQEEPIERARELGRRRARQGLSIELMLGAYHITFREAWNPILRKATVDEPEHIGELAHMVALIWTWFRVLMGNASEAYGEELRRAQVTRATLAHRLFAALTADPVQPEPAATLARALGYEPDGEFQSLCLPAGDWQDDGTDRLRHRLSALPGVLHCATADTRLLVLGQRHDPDAVVSAAAVDSITDATQALSQSGGQQRVVRFSRRLAHRRPRRAGHPPGPAVHRGDGRRAHGRARCPTGSAGGTSSPDWIRATATDSSRRWSRSASIGRADVMCHVHRVALGRWSSDPGRHAATLP